MSPALQPMAVQYYCHVSPSVSGDQYTAMPLEGVLVTWYGHISYIYTFCYNFFTFFQLHNLKNTCQMIKGFSAFLDLWKLIAFL